MQGSVLSNAIHQECCGPKLCEEPWVLPLLYVPKWPKLISLQWHCRHHFFLFSEMISELDRESWGNFEVWNGLLSLQFCFSWWRRGSVFLFTGCINLRLFCAAVANTTNWIVYNEQNFVGLWFWNGSLCWILGSLIFNALYCECCFFVVCFSNTLVV